MIRKYFYAAERFYNRHFEAFNGIIIGMVFASMCIWAISCWTHWGQS